ncbi:MFS transporter [Rapidithrix thailandica]|uniref:MFS transporter n=1 Tax=Rapidithrix thailandica TaxID=413964 RepID=A0AAW9SJK6_9BACT
MKEYKLLLYLLAAVNFTHIMDFMIIMPLADIFMSQFQIDTTAFSLLVTSYKFSAGVVGLIGVTFIDRFDRKKLLLSIYIGFSIGTFFCGLSNSYSTLLIARIITGGFGGLIGALVLSIVGDAIPLSQRASAMGVVMSSFGLASVAGIPFGLYLTDLINWRMPFFVLATGSVIVGLFMFKVMPSMKEHVTSKQVSTIRKFKNIFSNKNQVIALLLGVILISGQYTIIPFLAPYMLKNVGFLQEQLKYIYLAGGLCSFFISPWIGRMADRFGRLKVFAATASLVTIPIYLLTHLPETSLLHALIITSLFFILASGRIVTVQTMITAVVTPESRGSFMSMRTAIQQLGSGLAAFVSGIIITVNASGQLTHYDTVGYIAIASSFLAILLARALKVVPEKEEVVYTESEI